MSKKLKGSKNETMLSNSSKDDYSRISEASKDHFQVEDQFQAAENPIENNFNTIQKSLFNTKVVCYRD